MVMDDERAEGFWWARWPGSPEWSVLKVHNPGDTYFHGSDVPLAMHEAESLVWGPYMGKDPSHMLDLEHRVSMATRRGFIG
jgi:hypothetical protein